jgi:DNA topoisomerase IA
VRKPRRSSRRCDGQDRHRRGGEEADQPGAPAALRSHHAAARGERPPRFPAQDDPAIAQALYESTRRSPIREPIRATCPRITSPRRSKCWAAWTTDRSRPHAQKALARRLGAPNKRIFNNAKVSDHFAIVPTGVVPKGMSETEAEDFRHGFAAIHRGLFPAAQFEVTTRITTVESEKFPHRWQNHRRSGWLAVYGKQARAKARTTKPLWRSARRKRADRAYRGKGMRHQAGPALHGSHAALRPWKARASSSTTKNCAKP